MDATRTLLDRLSGWEAVIGVLQQVQQAGSPAEAAVAYCGVELAVNLASNQTLSQAAWKKLIQKDKVGGGVGAVGVRARITHQRCTV